VAISESVKYPWAFYTVESGNWTNSAGTDGTGFAWNDPAATAGAKSVYDPCPPGWRMPANGVWNDFDRTVNGALVNTQNPARDLAWGVGRGSGSAVAPVNGLRYWPGTTGTDPVGGRIWFPATGLRYVSSGALWGTGSGGYYWSGTANSPVGAHHLHFYAGTVYPSNGNNRAFGFAARCVSE
jgi:hypothetical protein